MHFGHQGVPHTLLLATFLIVDKFMKGITKYICSHSLKIWLNDSAVTTFFFFFLVYLAIFLKIFNHVFLAGSIRLKVYVSLRKKNFHDSSIAKFCPLYWKRHLDHVLTLPLVAIAVLTLIQNSRNTFLKYSL